MSSFNFNSMPTSNYPTTSYPDSFGSILPDNSSYNMITPQYSPETTVAITLRHFEKEAKSQAEQEYDDENGALPPPPPEDDPSIDPETRKAHKKRRKVRSAIVSRRKTAIYLEKLETELETRDGMNSTLAKNLGLYREVITDIQAKIEVMNRTIKQRSSKRVRSPYDPVSTSSGRITRPRRPHPTSNFQRASSFPVQSQLAYAEYSETPQSQYNYALQNQQHQPHQQSEYTTPNNETVFIPTDPTTPDMTCTPTPSSHHQHSSSNNQDVFLENPQSTMTDLFSTISNEEIGDTSVPTPAPPQLSCKQTETDFSECSDRNMSPVLRPEASSQVFHDESNFQIPVASQAQPWGKQSLEPFQDSLIM